MSLIPRRDRRRPQSASTPAAPAASPATYLDSPTLYSDPSPSASCASYDTGSSTPSCCDAFSDAGSSSCD